MKWQSELNPETMVKVGIWLPKPRKQQAKFDDIVIQVASTSATGVFNLTFICITNTGFKTADKHVDER